MAVVTLGAHILDVLARPVESIPDGQDTVVVDEIRVTAAGAAAGTAVALARLGNDVVSVGAVGDDDLGDLLVRIMERNGVDVPGLVRRTADQTSASILPIRPDGGRPSFHVPGANLTLTAGAVGPGLLSAAESRAPRRAGRHVRPQRPGVLRDARPGPRDRHRRRRWTCCPPCPTSSGRRRVPPARRPLPAQRGAGRGDDRARRPGQGRPRAARPGPPDRRRHTRRRGQPRRDRPRRRAAARPARGRRRHHGCGDAYCAGFITGLARDSTCWRRPAGAPPRPRPSRRGSAPTPASPTSTGSSPC